MINVNINLTKLITNLTDEIKIDDEVTIDDKLLENTDIKKISKEKKHYAFSIYD